MIHSPKMANEYREEISDPLIWKMLGIVRQLLPIQDLDQLLKAGVELPRRELGVERCALWLLNVDGQSFRGTWGTAMDGGTSDERLFHCSLASLEDTLSCSFQSLEGWSLRKETNRLTWTPEGTIVEGSGWNTIIPLSGPEGNVGAFFQDSAITNRPLDPHLQDMMTVYCSLLGQLAGRRLAENREFFMSHGLEQLLVAADELMTYDDLNSLHRRIVELARERMGVVRGALFVTTDNPMFFSGTWGTDWEGRTTDEHLGGFTMFERGVEKQSQPSLIEFGARRWTAKQPYRMSWFEPNGERIDFAEGWNALHPLAVKDRILGYLCTDPGKSGEALDPRKMDLLTTYCDLAARILDRHQTQEGLREAMHAAEQATVAKSEFLASMSHEIRTPLAGVLGMLRISLRDNLLSDPVRHTLQKALGSAESLLGIINDILDYSKIEAGKLSLEAIDFSLPDLLDNALAVFFEIASGRNLTFQVRISPSLPRFFKGDPTRLSQILNNLVGNAVKFTEHGGVTVTVDARKLEVGKHLLEISVTDSGIGISAEVLPKLFSKFEQADMSTTRRFGGTGLGLAICKQLVDAMGGTIQVESEIEKGTHFWVAIPLELGVELAAELLPERTAHTHRLRVLCAEDYPTTQIIVRTLLEEAGHAVDIVDNGFSALQHLATSDYDLVLMDSRMPQMDGLEAVRHLRSGHYGDLIFRDPQVTIVAFTANVSAEDRRKFLAVGIDDFLPKPIDEAAFHRVIEAAILRQVKRGRILQPLIHASPSSLDALFQVDSKDRTTTPLLPREPEIPLQQRLEAVFRNTLPDRLRELNDADQHGDAAALASLFHGLRGSAGYVKATGIAQQAKILEGLSDQGNLLLVRQRLPQFLTELQTWLPTAVVGDGLEV